MFERLKRLYKEGKLDKTGIENAVAKGWITQEQADEITGEEEFKAERARAVALNFAGLPIVILLLFVAVQARRRVKERKRQ